jgi:hypothetical protein
VPIDWTAQFDNWLDRLEAQAAAGGRIAQLQLDYIDAQLEVLEELDAEPTEDTAVLKQVRQSRRYPVWRVSHPYDPDVAIDQWKRRWNDEVPTPARQRAPTKNAR